MHAWWVRWHLVVRTADIWTGTAIDLAYRGAFAVCPSPVGGRRIPLVTTVVRRPLRLLCGGVEQRAEPGRDALLPQRRRVPDERGPRDLHIASKQRGGVRRVTQLGGQPVGWSSLPDRVLAFLSSVEDYGVCTHECPTWRLCHVWTERTVVGTCGRRARGGGSTAV
jgi:hypothetical protein